MTLTVRASLEAQLLLARDGQSTRDVEVLHRRLLAIEGHAVAALNALDEAQCLTDIAQRGRTYSGYRIVADPAPPTENT